MALSKHSVSIFMMCLLCAFKEGLFVILAPFFPELMIEKGVPDYYYAPLFV